MTQHIATCITDALAKIGASALTVRFDSDHDEYDVFFHEDEVPLNIVDDYGMSIYRSLDTRHRLYEGGGRGIKPVAAALVDVVKRLQDEGVIPTDEEYNDAT